MHAISLQPGQTVTVHLPRGHSVRVHHPTSRLTRHDLDFSLTNGSGLHVFQTPRHAHDERALMLVPNSPGPFRMRITRAPEHQSPLTVALFLSRYDPHPVAPYRDINIDLPKVSLRERGSGVVQRFWSFKPYDPLQFTIEGPARLAVENRFVYDLGVQQPKQTYRIYTRLDGAPLQVLEVATDIDVARPVFVRRNPQHVSRLEVDYIDIPTGSHTVEMETTAPIYLRLRRQSRADYALPNFNRPAPMGPHGGVTPPLLYTPIWQIDASQLRRMIKSPTSSVVELEYLAKRLWRDNRHRDGGLQAAMLLRRVATLRPHDVPLQRAATRQLDLSTFYSHLLPERKTTVAAQYTGWFTTPRLQSLDHKPTPYAAAKQHQTALTSRLKSGHFVQLPAHPNTHHYVIPPRSAPSQLRFVVDTTALSQPQELWIQFDQRPPRRLHLIPQATVATQPPTPTSGEIGLTLLRLQNPEFGGGTLGGPFSRRRRPAPLLRTAHAVLPLPAHVHRIKVWQTYNRSEAVSIALQYRLSKPFHLSERSYLDALDHLGSPSTRLALLLDQVTALQHNAATFDVTRLSAPSNLYTRRAAIEVVNQWLPLMRLLRARYKRFVGALSPPAPVALNRPPPDLQQRRTRAQRAEAAGDWLAALETWASIANTPQGAFRREARMAQVRALQHLGRHALADRLLRGMMLFDTDTQLRTQAFNHLLSTYRQTEKIGALGALLAVAAIRQQQPDALRMLTTQFVADGQYRSALLLGLALPAPQRPVSPLLQAAWRLGWWRAFDALLSQINSEEERHYWLGYRAVQQADFDTAQQHFLQAGSPGQALAGAVAQARIIHANLQSDDIATQEQGALTWEAWQGRHPGPYTWQREPQLIADAAGGTRLYQPALDLYSQWYRSKPARPVQLSFHGPLRLRLSIRPLHPRGASTPLDTWVRIDHDQQRRLVPIIGNRPSQALMLIPPARWQPGQRIAQELSFGPGRHTVTIAGEATPLLVQAEAQRPALPLGILPPLTPQTLLAMLSSRPSRPNQTPQRRHCTACLYLIDDPRTRAVALTAMPPQEATQRSPRLDPLTNQHLSSLENRLRLRRPRPSGREIRRTQVERLVFQHDVAAALAIPYDASAEGLYQHMTLLLRHAEQQPEHYGEALNAARELLAEHPGHPPLFALFARMTRRSKWQRLTTVQRSSGLHFAERHGWHPESPLLRANKALLRPVGPDEHVASGLQRLLITLNNLKAAVFDVTMESEDLPYAPPMPMTAVYQIDDQTPIDVHLAPSRGRHTVRLLVPEGQHALRFYIREPVINQFLRLNIIEIRRASARPLQRRFERAYHIATHAEPVEILLAGPSWLRIDQWSKSGIRTRYQTVAAGWQTLTFYPEPGQREALLRLFQRIPAPEVSPLPPRQLAHEPDLIPSPLATSRPLKRFSLVELHDAYPLGKQEDGTWSIGSRFVSRRNTQEDVGLSDAERFAELSATHRYADPFKRLYTETEALGRWRTDGGPTLGLKHILAYRPARRSLALRLSGTGFLQLPIKGTDLAASGTLRGSASYGFSLGPKATHRPSISIFGRLLSLDNAKARANTGRIDLDVFSAFKADHRVGLSIAETVTYRPWLDTIWSGKINVATNPDFNLLQPDRVTLRLEWKQLIGPLQLHTAYRFGYFLADDDRRTSLDRHTLILDARWEHWRPSRQRFDVRLRARYDLRSGDLGFLLGVSWHTGTSRAYRDFRPGTIHFRRLRQYRIPSERKNRLRHAETS